MSFLISKTVFILLTISCLEIVSLKDDIVVSAPKTNFKWSSLSFILPVEASFDYYWVICRQVSQVYCLHTFHSADEKQEVQVIEQTRTNGR